MPKSAVNDLNKNFSLPSRHQAISNHDQQPHEAFTLSKRQSIIKATIAFILATSFTFCPYLNNFLVSTTNVTASTQLVAVSTLFFNPCRSVGAMLEAMWMGVFGLAFASLITTLGWWSVVKYPDTTQTSVIVYQSISLLSLLFLATFVLAFVRARGSKPPIYAGTIMAHWLVSITLTDLPKIQAYSRDSPVPLLCSVVLPLACGMMISLFVNVLVWPTKATSQLKAQVSQCLASSRHLTSSLTSAFLLDVSTARRLTMLSGDTSSSVDTSQITELMAQHRLTLVSLSRANEEAKLEFFARFSGTMTGYYQPLIASLNRITQHLGGMQSSVLKEAAVLKNSKSDQRVERLLDFVEHVGPTVKRLSESTFAVLTSATALLHYQRKHYWFWYYLPTIDRRSRNAEWVNVLNEIRALQGDLTQAIEEFTHSQRTKLLSLYEQEKFDGRPNDQECLTLELISNFQVFLTYFFIFCLVEVAKEIRDGLLTTMVDINVRKLGRGYTSSGLRKTRSMYVDEEAPLLYEQDEELVDIDESLVEIVDGTETFQYLKSQTNGAYHQYLKAPASASVSAPAIRTKQTSNVSLFLRYRLRLWRFLSDIRHSFDLKFAFKTALLVTAIATLAFIPETAAAYRDFRGDWSILSVVVVMTPTVGGTNVAGMYRILGTLAGAMYAYIAWTLFPSSPIGLATLLTLFSIPCFYGVLFTTYPKVFQVSLVTVCAIVLANFAHLGDSYDDNDGLRRWSGEIFELAWKRAVMVSSGIALGLVVTWYIWPYEARVELRKGVSSLFLDMGVLYSRLVEVFNDLPSTVAESARARKKGGSKITASTLHRFYYAEFDQLSSEDTLSYFMAYELKLQMSLMRLRQLLPLTWLEPRLKGPFPVQVYEQILSRCQKILDNFVAMRVAISNNLDSAAGEYNSSFATYREDLILGLAPAPSSSSHKISSKHADTRKLPSHPQLIPYRRELVGSVLLMFYVYSGSLILKQPLPTYLPPSRQARVRLLDKIHQVITQIENDEQDSSNIVNENSDKYGTARSRTLSASPAAIQRPEKYINYYAYALALEDVIQELEGVGVQLKSLFGEMFADVVVDCSGNEDDQEYLDDDDDSDVSSPEDIRPLSNKVPIHHHRNDLWGAQHVDGILSPRQMIRSVLVPSDASVTPRLNNNNNKNTVRIITSTSSDDINWKSFRDSGGSWML